MPVNGALRLTLFYTEEGGLIGPASGCGDFAPLSVAVTDVMPSILAGNIPIDALVGSPLKTTGERMRALFSKTRSSNDPPPISVRNEGEPEVPPPPSPSNNPLPRNTRYDGKLEATFKWQRDAYVLESGTFEWTTSNKTDHRIKDVEMHTDLSSKGTHRLRPDEVRITPALRRGTYTLYLAIKPDPTPVIGEAWLKEGGNPLCQIEEKYTEGGVTFSISPEVLSVASVAESMLKRLGLSTTSDGTIEEPEARPPYMFENTLEYEAEDRELGETQAQFSESWEMGGAKYSISWTIQLPERELQIVSMPDHFAPGVESLPVTYNISGLVWDSVVMRISSESYPGKIVFERELTLAERSDGDHKTLAWNGQTTTNGGPLAGSFINPAFSPYRIQLESSSFTPRRSSCSSLARESIKIIIDDIELTTNDDDGRYIMNKPGSEFDIVAKALIRNIANDGVIAPCPIEVVFTFDDPGDPNTPPGNSVTHTDGVPLGKQGSKTVTFWRAAPGWPAISDDAFNASARVDVSTAANGDRGLAKILFQPAGCGGDDYRLRASVFAADRTTLLEERKSPTLTVFRRVKFTGFEMTGRSHISRNAGEGSISPFYRHTFVKYRLNAIKKIPANFSVRYIGLWDHATGSMASWKAIQSKVQSKIPGQDEVPGQDEITAANGPDGDARKAARAAIQNKAIAWFERIAKAARVAIDHWLADVRVDGACLPLDAVIGVYQDHPKFSGYASRSDSKTEEWTQFPWVQITLDDGKQIHPDESWGARGGMRWGEQVIIFSSVSDEETKNTIAHEVGHATKAQFTRARFGEPGDHSSTKGLMDKTGSLMRFNSKETRILRGLLP